MNKKQKHHQSIIPGNTNSVNVIGSTREDLSFALKTWKRKIKHSKILERTKELTEFIKPSIKKRQQLTNANIFIVNTLSFYIVSIIYIFY